MAHKLDIFKALSAVDHKNYGFYDKLTEEERKGFTAFLMNKWNASVEGNNAKQHYYLASTNHYVNKHLFDLSKHPKLQWLLLAASSPGLGTQRHIWLKAKKKANNTAVKKQLREMHPTYKEDDIELLSKLVTKKELKQYVKDCGNTK